MRTVSMNQSQQSRQSVLNQIEQACQRVQRDPATVQLLAVSKTHPASSLREMYAVGQRSFGENYLQEALAKVEDLQDLDLSGKIYGVVGSGDTFYDYFCKSVDEFEEQFALTGAIKGADSVKVDLAAEDEDIDNLEAFAEAISEAMDNL